MERGQVIGIFDASANRIWGSAEEIRSRSCELIAMGESSVISKSPLDPVVMEDGKGYACPAKSSSVYEGDRDKAFGETDDSSNQLVTSETGPWYRGRYASNIGAG